MVITRVSSINIYIQGKAHNRTELQQRRVSTGLLY